MSLNENLLGLASMWDTEIANVEWDARREERREFRGTHFLRDAISELADDGGITVTVSGSERAVHLRRIGMMWADGVECSTEERVIVPFAAFDVVTSQDGCPCAVVVPTIFELVPFGAVLRELERQGATILVSTRRRGAQGRITGVWRDALAVKTVRGIALFPYSSVERIVVPHWA